MAITVGMQGFANNILVFNTRCGVWFECTIMITMIKQKKRNEEEKKMM